MPARNSVDHAAMREMNVTLILDTLRIRSPLSRAALAGRTGLNKASITSMVRELIDAGYVREIGAAEGNVDVGRPAINLKLNPDAGCILSAEIGVDFISLIAANFCFEIVNQRTEYFYTVDDHTLALDKLVEMLDELYEELTQQGKVVFGIAIGLPGLVDMRRGHLLFAPNLNWQDVAVKSRLQAQFSVPILVSNEANMAAFGEGYFGIGQRSRLLLYVSSGVGLGGGIVSEGRLLAGANGLAGEVGHMSLNPEGALCHCGSRGCWETEATQAALFRHVHAAITSGLPSSLAARKDQLSVRRVLDAARMGDDVALTAFAETGRWLGIGLANLINALNPEHVVFGGSMSIAYELLMPHMQAEIQLRAFRWMWEQVKFQTATYAANAAVMGGVAMLHHHVIQHPMSWHAELEQP